jgi:hypothetical protein
MYGVGTEGQFVSKSLYHVHKLGANHNVSLVQIAHLIKL